MSRNKREGRYHGKVGGEHRRYHHWTYWLIAPRIWRSRTSKAEAAAPIQPTREE